MKGINNKNRQRRRQRTQMYDAQAFTNARYGPRDPRRGYSSLPPGPQGMVMTQPSPQYAAQYAYNQPPSARVQNPIFHGPGNQQSTAGAAQFIDSLGRLYSTAVAPHLGE